MKKFLEHNKNSVAEVVLLGVFMVGILLAWGLVTFRARVHFSYNVPLPFSGISVSLPAGEGWNPLDHWMYNPQNNSFVLAVEFQMQRGQNADVYLEWEYLLAESNVQIETKIEGMVAYLGGVIIDQGDTNFGDTPMAWARFAQPSREKDAIVGFAELAFGRYLKLIIYTEDPELLSETFKGAVAAVKYAPNNMAVDGERFVEQMKPFLVGNILPSKADAYSDRLYLTRKVSQVGNTTQLAGFSAERYSTDESNGRNGIAAKRLQYLSGKNGWTDRGYFKSNNDLSEFTWQNNRQIKRGEFEVLSEIRVDGQRTLTINRNPKQFKLSSFCIPEMILELAAGEFIGFDSEAVLLDILIHDGRVVPAVMSKKDVTLNEKGDSGYEVRFDFLYGGNSYEALVFDSMENLIRKNSKGNGMLVTEKSSWDELYLKFEKWVDDFEEIFPQND